MVVRGANRRRLAGGRWLRRGRPERPVPAGPRACELPREVDGEGTEAAVGVRVKVVGVACGPPAGLLLDEGVRPKGGVRGSQGGVRGGGGVEVQNRSPLRCRADGQSRAAGAGARWDRGQQGVQVTDI